MATIAKLETDLRDCDLERKRLDQELRSAGEVLSHLRHSRLQLYLIFVTGVVFMGVLLYLALSVSYPTIWQYTVFRTILALGAAGVAALLPGDFDFRFKSILQATGAIGVFAFVYLINPAALVGLPKPIPPEDLKAVLEKRLNLISQQFRLTEAALLRVTPSKASEVNEFNNQLIELWRKMVGYGFASDPYYQGLQLGAGGVSPVQSSDFGIREISVSTGMPELFRQYISAVNKKPEVYQKYESLVAAYKDVTIYPFLESADRMEQYRTGHDLTSKTFADDMQHYHIWIDGLAKALHGVSSLIIEN